MKDTEQKIVERKILTIARMIYMREGCDSKQSLKEFFESSHPAESSIAWLALNIYNFITNSEYDESEFTE